MINANFVNQESHIPVMLNEVLRFLKPQKNEIFFDGTFGAGGYSQAILESCECSVIAVDRDNNVQKFVDKILEKFPQNFKFNFAKFSQIKQVLANHDLEKIDGVVLDVGVSSMQLDERQRGFSFDSTQKLDMRMDQTQELSAYEVVNEFSVEDLTKIIRDFGDEPKAKKIAQKIATNRSKQTITSCCELADIVRSLYVGYYKTDPATRTFQALRIFVNNELEELRLALDSALHLLKKGGRMVVVSFHSLEDKIVKDFFRSKSGITQSVSRYEPQAFEQMPKILQLLNKSAIEPSDLEVKKNPRSRSAKLRAVIKL
jgi:16S rRNA (cytosine1402-N4)-methyltransferase